MTTAPCVVDSALTLNDAQERMRFNNIRHLVVERNGRLAGVVSLNDIAVAQSLRGTRARVLCVADAMSTNVFVCSPFDELALITFQMEAQRYDCVLVVENYLVVGMFTTTEALRALREVLQGRPVERASDPYNSLPKRERSPDMGSRHVRLRDMLVQHGSAPRANDGMLFSH